MDVTKEKDISRSVDQENLIYVRWNRIKNCIKTKNMIDRGKRSRTLSEVKWVENISKNLQSFLEISPVQKQVLPLHKSWDHAYKYWNLFGLKEDSPSQKNCQNQFSHPGFFHIEQECQESLIQGKVHNWDLYKEFWCLVDGTKNSIF